MNFRCLLVTLVAMLISACSEQPDTAAANDDLAARGAELLAPFKSSLMQALSAGMQEGPEVAIEVCSDKAPSIAREMSVKGVRIGRSSHKLRNPENVAPDWLAPILADYASGAAELRPRTVALGDGRHGYVEPLVTRPLCVTCHGPDIDGGIAAQLAASYPDDQATGFEVGDFRGVAWVEF